MKKITPTEPAVITSHIEDYHRHGKDDKEKASKSALCILRRKSEDQKWEETRQAGKIRHRKLKEGNLQTQKWEGAGSEKWESKHKLQGGGRAREGDRQQGFGSASRPSLVVVIQGDAVALRPSFSQDGLACTV